MIVGTNRSLLLGSKVSLVKPERVVAEWAHRSIEPNNNFLYIVAKYVEADKVNENGHFWAFEDLKKSERTMVNAPINLMHQPHDIVGVMVDQEMIYPTVDAGKYKDKDKKKKKASATSLETQTFSDGQVEPFVAYDYAQPYIEVLGALWKFYFPKTVAGIEAAQEMGQLHISMECVSESVTRVDTDGTEETYPFTSGNVKDYGWNENSMHCRLNNPYFLGAGLVLPPAKPGWSGAEVYDLIGAMSDDQIDSMYEQIQSENPQLTPRQWETLMFALLDRGDS